jgi:hypothetical protein
MSGFGDKSGTDGGRIVSHSFDWDVFVAASVHWAYP